jgi:hypothetical protein
MKNIKFYYMKIELNSNSIEEKWDANWWKSYCEFDCGYGG